MYNCTQFYIIAISRKGWVLGARWNASSLCLPVGRSIFGDGGSLRGRFAQAATNMDVRTTFTGGGGCFNDTVGCDVGAVCRACVLTGAAVCAGLNCAVAINVQLGVAFCVLYSARKTPV